MKEYVVVIGGIEHTMLLDEETATRLGVKPVESKQAKPANKSRTPENKEK